MTQTLHAKESDKVRFLKLRSEDTLEQASIQFTKSRGFEDGHKFAGSVVVELDYFTKRIGKEWGCILITKEQIEELFGFLAEG